MDSDLKKPIKKDKYDISDDDDDSTDWGEDEETIYPDFPDFDKRILEALDNFGNKVFIKLNWSSPKDAFWALNKLACERLSDIYILLKSSDFVNHDLNHSFEHCEDQNSTQIKNFQYNLIVRDWININSSMEFRCFVHKNLLMGNLNAFILLESLV